MKKALLKELEKEFVYIRNQKIGGVSGVLCFDSGVPGPCVGVTISTHGNEPSGLAALHYFREKKIADRLTRGSVVFVLNNILACERYFASLRISDPQKRETGKRAARFYDVNMNRLPANTLRLSNDHRYEIRRAIELRSVWKRFDVGLDIHSTKSASDPMIVALGRVSPQLYDNFPIRSVIRNIERIQTGKPASYFYGKPGVTPVFGIEAGSHESLKAFQVAAACVVTLLDNMNMLESGKNRQRTAQKREYKINQSVFFPNESYLLVKRFSNFEKIKAGDIIAKGNGKDIVASRSGHIIFAPPGLKPVAPLTDEVLFLSD
jgi:predicted deacylase